MFVDSYKHKGMRRLMVEHLSNKGISDQRVLDAMNNVPRHFFLDSSLDTLAYEDRALEILCQQTISQPSTVAYQTQLLDVSPFEKIMEIGTGSGYQTSVLCKMQARVYTIERFKPFHSHFLSFLLLVHQKYHHSISCNHPAHYSADMCN